MGTRVEPSPRNSSKRMSGHLGLGVPDKRTAVDIVSVPALDAGSRDCFRAPLGRQRNNIVAHQPQHDVQTDAAEKMVRAQAVVYTSVRYFLPVHLAPVSLTVATLVTDWNALFKPPKVPRDSVLVGQWRHQSKRVHQIIPFGKRHVLQSKFGPHIVATQKGSQPRRTCFWFFRGRTQKVFNQHHPFRSGHFFVRLENLWVVVDHCLHCFERGHDNASQLRTLHRLLEVQDSIKTAPCC